MAVTQVSRLRPTCTARPICVARQTPRRRAQVAHSQGKAPSPGPTPPPPKGLACASAAATGAVGMAAAAAVARTGASALSRWALALHFTPEQAPTLLGAAVAQVAAALALVPLTALAARQVHRVLRQRG